VRQWTAPTETERADLVAQLERSPSTGAGQIVFIDCQPQDLAWALAFLATRDARMPNLFARARPWQDPTGGWRLRRPGLSRRR
jgi:hypothetical protein